MTLPWVTAVDWEAWGASAGGLEGVETWGRGGLSEATEGGEECPSGSVLTLSSDIRILMLIRTSTQTLPSHCGRRISHFPQGPADSSKLLSLVQMGRFISTGSFLWGQDFSWNTSQISLLLLSSLYFSGRLGGAHGERNSEKVGVDFGLRPLLAVGAPAHYWLLQAAVSFTKSGCDIVHLRIVVKKKDEKVGNISTMPGIQKSSPKEWRENPPNHIFSGLWQYVREHHYFHWLRTLQINPVLYHITYCFILGLVL